MCITIEINMYMHIHLFNSRGNRKTNVKLFGIDVLVQSAEYAHQRIQYLSVNFDHSAEYTQSPNTSTSRPNTLTYETNKLRTFV